MSLVFNFTSSIRIAVPQEMLMIIGETLGCLLRSIPSN
jgi:hypothetical protein